MNILFSQFKVSYDIINPIVALGTQSSFPPTMTSARVCLVEVRYLTITDESRPVGPPGLPELSAGPELWPLLVVFGASTAPTSSASAWLQSYVVPWCLPDLYSSAPGGGPPAPTPVPELLQHPGAAYQTEPALGSWLYSLWLEKDNDNPHTGRSSSTYRDDVPLNQNVDITTLEMGVRG